VFEFSLLPPGQGSVGWWISTGGGGWRAAGQAGRSATLV